MKTVKNSPPVQGVVRATILSAFASIQFMIANADDGLTKTVMQKQLVDPEAIKKLHATVSELQDIDDLNFTLQDQIQIYTCIDLSCKIYLTDLGERLVKFHAKNMKEQLRYREVRNVLIKISSQLLDAMNRTLIHIPAFKQRVDLLREIECA